jgi:hypothetical protein
MADEVYMSVPDVQKLSSDFKSLGDVLDGIDKMIKAAIAMLQATAFISLGTTEGIAMYLQQIEPNFTKAANEMRTLSTDITSAITAYQTGDTSGSRRFVG